MMCALPLLDGRVDLWYALPETITDIAILDRYRALLTPEETAESQRFAFERDRHRFLVRRALVRAVLSAYTGNDPGAWVFRRNEYGKPEVAEPVGMTLRFNLSHTAGLVVCAVTSGRDVGVDVEALERQPADLERQPADLERQPADLDVARRYFAPAEIATLERLPEQRRQEVFFQFWTLKEAYIKARGMGLSIPLDDFALTLSEDRPPAISFAAGCDGDPDEWQFAQIRLQGRYQVAIAIRLPGPSRLTVRLRQTTPLVSEGEWLPLP
ncbi:MAG: 4'-phosphopantetheinyl transferase superfamily protein [Candidatus Nealsonbacteria bacterium]|nr:4'-phosphopantetheinyl transferase superfamily protein [Candidatus Nealsonbacteria bacterium]